MKGRDVQWAEVMCSGQSRARALSTERDIADDDAADRVRDV